MLFLIPTTGVPDLNVCLASVRAYGGNGRILVAYSRDSPNVFLGDLVDDCSTQPRNAHTYGAAMEYLCALALARYPDESDFILMNDDATLTPTTLDLLLEDVTATTTSYTGPTGFVACRSNYIRPTQQSPHQRHAAQLPLTPADVISPVCAYAPRTLLEDMRGRWPDTNWYSDDIVCHDTRELGYTHYISRAWVHHNGESATSRTVGNPAALEAQGKAWLLEHRPDIAQYIT